MYLQMYWYWGVFDFIHTIIHQSVYLLIYWSILRVFKHYIPACRDPFSLRDSGFFVSLKSNSDLALPPSMRQGGNVPRYMMLYSGSQGQVVLWTYQLTVSKRHEIDFLWIVALQCSKWRKLSHQKQWDIPTFFRIYWAEEVKHQLLIGIFYERY